MQEDGSGVLSEEENVDVMRTRTVSQYEVKPGKEKCLLLRIEPFGSLAGRQDSCGPSKPQMAVVLLQVNDAILQVPA